VLVGSGAPSSASVLIASPASRAAQATVDFGQGLFKYVLDVNPITLQSRQNPEIVIERFLESYPKLTSLMFDAYAHLLASCHLTLLVLMAPDLANAEAYGVNGVTLEW
jgi:hypothetical protein